MLWLVNCKLHHNIIPYWPTDCIYEHSKQATQERTGPLFTLALRIALLPYIGRLESDVRIAIVDLPLRILQRHGYQSLAYLSRTWQPACLVVLVSHRLLVPSYLQPNTAWTWLLWTNPADTPFRFHRNQRDKCALPSGLGIVPWKSRCRLRL